MTDSEPRWPAGFVLEGVRFGVSVDGCRSLAELPPPISQHALLVPREDALLEVLSIPIDQPEATDSGEQMREWVLAGGGPGSRYQLVTMHGAQVHWCPPRVALAAFGEVVEPLRRTLVELAYLDSELHAIETGLAQLWPQAEADAPRAFEFRHRDLRQRESLGQRFMQVTLLHSRLARILPTLLAPQPYPPTLPGQVQERLRERLAMPHRLESLQTQIELFERIYEGCGQRASEFVLTRKSLNLEWVIIILLALQTALLLFELLVGVGG